MLSIAALLCSLAGAPGKSVSRSLGSKLYSERAPKVAFPQ